MSALELRDDDGEPIGTWSPEHPPPPDDSPARMRLSCPERPELSTDVFGVPEHGLRRRPPVPTAVTLAIDVFAADAPFGPVATRLLVRGSGAITSSLWLDRAVRAAPPVPIASDPMAIEATYAQILSWLHGRVRFGNLLWLGCPARGDWFGFSALAGIVQAPRVPVPEDEVIARLMVLVDPGGERSGRWSAGPGWARS